MKYKLTSAEASKLLKKIIDEKAVKQTDEKQSYIFNAALGEDIESVRPAYNYEETSQYLDVCNEKIRVIKHAINCFNTRQLVGDTGMTIDQVLVYIPQLTEKRNRLYDMQMRLPKQRSSVGGIGNNAVIDYRYVNYDIEKTKEDYMAVSDELRKLQTELDVVNTTVTMEFELPD